MQASSTRAAVAVSRLPLTPLTSPRWFAAAVNKAARAPLVSVPRGAAGSVVQIIGSISTLKNPPLLSSLRRVRGEENRFKAQLASSNRPFIRQSRGIWLLISIDSHSVSSGSWAGAGGGWGQWQTFNTTALELNYEVIVTQLDNCSWTNSRKWKPGDYDCW